MADAASDLEEAGSNNVLKDVFAGAVGGMAQVLIGMDGRFSFLQIAG